MEDPKKLFGVDTGKIKQAFQNWQAQLVTILADGTLTPQDSLEQRLASIESCMVQLKDSFN